MSDQHAHTDHQDRRVRVMGEPWSSFPERAPEGERGKALRITVVGEEVLHRPCAEVTEFGTAELGALIDDMFATMYVADGVGLAANQVGVGQRVFVYDCPDDDGVRHVGHLVNPVVEDLDPAVRRLEEANEGCLSVPGPYKEVARPDVTAVVGFGPGRQPGAPSRAPATSRAASSTRPTTSTATCTSTACPSVTARPR